MKPQALSSAQALLVAIRVAGLLDRGRFGEAFSVLFALQDEEALKQVTAHLQTLTTRAQRAN